MITENDNLSFSLSSRPYKSIDLRKVEIRQISLCLDRKIILLVSHDELLIIDVDYDYVVLRIKKLAAIRSAQLAPTGQFILSHYTDNTLRIICPQTGRELNRLIGVPSNSRLFYISEDGSKVIGGNNQMICLWKTSKAQIQILSHNWKNINCYAINHDGGYFAIGTFNGKIYVLKVLSENQCAQIEFNVHEKCVMIMAWNKQKLLSVSYDGIIVVFQAKENRGPQKTCVFKQYNMGFIPRSISCLEGRFYFFKDTGVFWFSRGQLISVEGDTWKVCKTAQRGISMGRLSHGKIDLWDLVES